MDQIRLYDIGRRNIRPTMRSVDRVLETSSEVGEKADYPEYQPCKKGTGGVHVYSHWLSPLSFVLNSTSHHDYSFYPQEKSQFVPSFSYFSRRHPTFARTININYHIVRPK